MNLFGSAPQDTPLANIRLQCHRIPVVECYKYLGISFRHHCLPPAPPLQPGLRRLPTRSLPRSASSSLLLSHPSPLAVKCSVCRAATRLPVLTPCSTRFYAPSPRAAPAFALLRMDLGIVPIFARMAGQRIRAFTKFRNSVTFISTLLGFPSNSRRRSWASGTKSWCTSFCPNLILFGY